MTKFKNIKCILQYRQAWGVSEVSLEHRKYPLFSESK